MAILADSSLKNELISKGSAPGVEILWVTAIEELLVTNADVYIDLLFGRSSKRVNELAALFPKPVFINSVIDTITELDKPFIRVNAWPGFLKRSLMEIAVPNTEYEKLAAHIFSTCGWPYQIAPDIPGMISARVIAMIINEAYFALGEGISTKDEIDIAMKLGTNYPLGPFEWAKIIGLENIYELLSRLYDQEERYKVAAALVEEMRMNGQLLKDI